MSELRISYDPALPVAAHAGDIAELIKAHQVVIVAGETGSGKTTQLPKICLEAGRRAIAHTQPRRIAARSVAARLAEEMGVELGGFVGYQVRFTRKAGRRTRVKVMTDGVLLAELAQDRELRRYDTIIVDEAHERSLNIDFLLGYLKRLLLIRPELKLIVTSATIDTARFSEHFDGAPIMEVSGRSYPVEVRYAPLGEREQSDGIADAVTELLAGPRDGDVLVFLSGEREIRDAAEALEGLGLGAEIVPLYARLSAAEQQRVFEAHSARRIVLATNVAETSITVPGIRFVVDTGTARISRYSARTKVQRLPIEAISQASANQRAGRCGRLGPGTAIRLYSEEDFAARPEYTEPEILRTNLAMVILQMAQAGLGDIASFPFVEAPPRAQITDGIRLLEELGALEGRQRRGPVRLTRVGRLLAQLPLDPRLGRMVIEAAARGCLREVLIIVSGLAIPDVRERPAERTEAADQAHRRFFCAGAQPLGKDTGDPPRYTVHTGRGDTASARPDDSGDFGALLRLWDYLRASRKKLSGNAFRRMCRNEFLNFLRVREWEDLHAQLKEICRELGLRRNDRPAPVSEVLTAVASGLLSHIGLAEVTEQPRQRGRRRPLKEYLGARGARFAIQPGSALARTTPPLVIAFELVETSRLWARTVAAVSAEQVEEVSGHVLSSTLSEPHWSPRSGRVQACEKLSLYGVPIVAGRVVDYGKREPVAAREIFIRRALVEGEWQTRHAFFAANQRVRAEAAELEDRTRRRDLLVDDQTIYDFYADRIPAQVCSTATFDKWWRTADQDVLTLRLEDLMTGEVDAGSFPDTWPVAGTDLAVTYIFDPSSGHDGVNVTIPMALLNQVSAAPFTWQVPGLRSELAVELLRTLPKSVRTRFVPAPEHAARALAWLRSQPREPGEPFASALGRALFAVTGQRVPEEAWQPERLPARLRVGFTVTDHDEVVGQGKDFDELRVRLTAKLNQTLTRVTAKSAISGARSWVFGSLQESLTAGAGGASAVGYPAIVDEGTGVGLRVFDTPQRRDRAHAKGVRRLLTLTNPDPTRWVVAHLANADKVALSHSAYPSVPALLADARLKAVDRLARRAGIGVRSEQEYLALAEAIRGETADEMARIVQTAARVLATQSRVQAALAGWPSGAPVRRDVEEQLGNLTFNNFISATPDPWFDRIPAYVEAMEVRLESARINPVRDAQLHGQVDDIESDYADLVASEPPGELRLEVEEIAFLLEEFRVSLFAQRLRTAVPVSAKRLRQSIYSVRGSHGPRTG